MTLSEQQKKIVNEALKMYWQMCKQQLPPDKALPIIQDIKIILAEFQKVEDNVEDLKPEAVTDEEFEIVCGNCDKYKHKCTDVVALKFPGKCDLILKFKQQSSKL
jgi:hypothetical protein